MLLYRESADNYEKAYFDSSDISYIKYRIDTKQMMVLFKNAHRLYLYENVERAKFLELRDADSLGRKFKEMMRKGRDKELYNVSKLGVLNEEESKMVEKIIKEKT